MSFLSQLPSTKSKSTKRLGRGYGSGVGGHTVGRGQKGQKARTKLPLLFAGTKNKKSIVQRLPVLRGKNKFKTLKSRPVIINLSQLKNIKSKSKITSEFLVEQGLVSEKELRIKGVKILGNGNISKQLEIHVPVSQTAKQKIESAGGKVVS